MLASQPLDATALLFTRNGLGSRPPGLQLKLARTCLQQLLEAETLPSVLCFYSEGVRLVVEGLPVLEPLRILEARGVHLVVCSTCLAYYGLTVSVRAGIVGGMPDIVEAQRRAEKVISV